MKARIWKDRQSGMWRYDVQGSFRTRTGARQRWEEALAVALGELDFQRAVRM